MPAILMSSHVVSTALFVALLLVLGAVLEVLDARERYWFVAGVVLVAGGTGLLTVLPLPPLLGGLLALVGVLAIVASTVPLLRQSPAAT